MTTWPANQIDRVPRTDRLARLEEANRKMREKTIATGGQDPSPPAAHPQGRLLLGTIELVPPSGVTDRLPEADALGTLGA